MGAWQQIAVNAGLAFASAYGAALSAGASQKEALAAGLAAIFYNQAGLFQRQPHK